MAELDQENKGETLLLGKEGIESTPLDTSKAVLKRRNAWKKLRKSQQIFSVFQAKLHQGAAAFESVGLDDEAHRYREAAGHGVRRCGCDVVPAMRRDKDGRMQPTKAPGVARVQVSKGGAGTVWTWVGQCGSVWYCPVCSPKVYRYRREELEKGMEVFRKHEFFFAFVTLTVPHTCGVPLLSYMLKLQEVLKKLRAGDKWTAFKSKYGVRGYIRTQEVMHGERHGWHPHYHELFVLEKPLDKKQGKAFEEFIRKRWLRLCTKEGLIPEDRTEAAKAHAVDVRLGGDPVAAKYMTKVAPWEMASTTTKAARNGKNMHPFQILDKALENGSDFQRWAGLWAEYLAGMYRRVAVFWSPGLKDFCGIKEVSDEEACQGEVEPEILLEAERDGFRQIARYGKQTAILELVERDKWPALWKLAWKINAEMCRPSDELEEGEVQS